MGNWDYGAFVEEALSQLKNTIDEFEYSIWLQNLKYVSSNQNTITMSAPSNFVRDKIIIKYQNLIEKELYNLSGIKLNIDIIVVKPNESDTQARSISINKNDDEPIRKKPIEKDFNIEEKQTNSSEKTRNLTHPQLRSDFTFDNYIVGENNEFASRIALMIADNPGTKGYNPFLIYGGVGLGKTHLMQAIGNKAFQKNPKLKIICISAENFTNEFFAAIEKKATQSFKNRYRDVDMLLIDDIHFFQKKPSVQEELFYTFNALFDKKKQLVFTCDRPASEFKDFEDRLRTRVSQGSNVDLQPPKYEIRYAILKKKAEARGHTINNEVLDYIAHNISTNIRDLESALDKIINYTDLITKGKEVTLNTAQELLKNISSTPKNEGISIDLVIKIIAEEYNIGINDIKGKKRTKGIVFPRQIAMYIIREITEYSTTEIGLEFGNRHHTSVIHSCQQIEEQLKIDPSLDTRIQKLMRDIRNQNNK